MLYYILYLLNKIMISCCNSDTAAERRRLAIQESKFLGGDMEHTHLVKGLDFALLQKVRSEINDEGEEAMGEIMKKAKHKDG